ncbi:M16 family metallopeptidase [Rhodohalobacter sp. 614A]|uniref:M16 family metallopeptidase n=1 Tax=Rhodohalobacter sp. 614A TaxID=2908649 RepID=UPI001F3931BE|nr:pitrilysin family protein [Rhodohalobacter sp. 614A]
MMKRIVFLSMLFLFANSALHAQKQYDELEYPELNEFQAPEVETFTTDNGIQFFLLEDKELPLIDLTVVIKTGSILDPAQKEGLASIAGTVMRSGGTEQYPSDSLNVLLENKAASMETGIGFTSGSASMNVLKEDFDELLPVFINLLTSPAFPDDKIELAKTQTKSSISRRNDDTQSIGVREFRRLIYGRDTPYGRNIEYETINNITRDDLVEFHDKHFVSENMMVGIVGDFDASEMKNKLEDAFSNIPSGQETNLDFPEVNYQPKSSINFANKSDVNQSFILMGHLGGLRDNPDYPQIQVMNRVLSGGFSGRLMQVIRTEMGLAYSAFGQYSMNSFYPGFFYAGVMTKSSTTAEAIEAVIGEIERLQNEPITQQELQDTKDQILNSAVFEYDSYEEILSQQISYEYQGLPLDAYEEYLNGVRETTIEDVQRVAREYLTPDQLEILVVGNSQELGDQLQQFGEVNEIDISIPEPGGQEETVAGDATAGRDWLNKMASAVLPGGPIEGELIFEAKNVVQTPQGEMNLDLEQTINFSTDKLVANVSMPMGQVTMQIEDGEGKMIMGGNEMPMPPAQKEQLMAEYHRNHVYLALKGADLGVEYLGMEEMEGQELAHIRVEANETIHLYLDPNTSLPIVRTYQQFDPQAGEQVTVKVVSNDWREADGVLMPYETVVYVGGEQSATTIVSTHSVE